MSERFRLFVYGQLRRGEIGYERLGLGARTDWLGEAQVAGQLYDLGDYPGLILGGSGYVHGELLGFKDPTLWTMLDDYEGCDPERPHISEYGRMQAELIGSAGSAWLYVYGRSVEGKPIITEGRWLAL